MKIDYQHILLFLAPVLIAIGNAIQTNGSNLSLSMVAAAVLGGVGMAFKQSIKTGPVTVASNDNSRGFIPLRVLVLLSLLAVTYLVAACAWFKANTPTIESDLTKDGICVLAEVGSGNVDPVSIGAVCGGLAVAQVEALVDAAMAKLSPSADAGVGSPVLTPNEATLLSRMMSIKAAIERSKLSPHAMR